MQVNHRKALLDLREKPLEPVNLQIRMQPALHQDSGAAELDRLADLLKDGVEIEDVALSSELALQRTIECAKRAVLGAEIGVINVAVNHVGNHVLRMQLAAERISFHTDADKLIRAQ